MFRSLITRWRRVAPGLLLCLLISLGALALQSWEIRFAGRAWIEALVFAILLGTTLRTVWTPGPATTPGIGFSAKFLLEVAVTLLGASISFKTVLAAGPALLAGVVAVVTVALCVSFGIGRLLRLPWRMATLVACGNSICGNSAIAAVAPVIGADSDDVASSIAFTAILGVVVVLTLPFLVPLLHLSPTQYGALAGLTVYAVPQVLAATAPVGLLAVQIGTLVKLLRVLMLGPVVLVLSLLAQKAGGGGKAARPKLHRLVPWFITGFLALATLRSLGFLPAIILPPALATANFLTIIAMAALGLGVDVRVLGRVGGRVTTTVTLSLLLLGGISLCLIHFIGLK